MNSSQIQRPEVLQSLPPDQLHDLTLRAVESVATGHLQLGNCLLAVERTGAFAEFGCSCMNHYASAVGVDKRLARDALLVARRLEELPVIRAAAEAGKVPWSNLREVTRVATPEHEQKWLQVACGYTSRIVERLTSQAVRGQAPGDPQGTDEATEPHTVQLTLTLSPEVVEMFQRSLASLSRELGTRLSESEAMELLMASYLLGSPTPATVERLKERMRQDLAAMAEADERLAERVRYDLESPPDERPTRVTEPPAAPWAAVAARETPVPGSPELRTISRGRIHWTNERLRFNGESRHTTTAQRQEILRRDCYACSTPGCPHNLWLDVHHIVFFCEGGITLPSNLVAVCSGCHKNIHEGRLRVRGTAPGDLEWQDAAGFSMRRLRHLPLPCAPPAGGRAPTPGSLPPTTHQCGNRS